MENLTSVLIGIQARSTSQRLPKKCFEPIGGRRMLDHVVEACQRAAKYSNKYTYRKNYTVNIALLIPDGDIIKRAFTSSQAEIIEGPEFDVLTRFMIAQAKHQADYVCRITGDCPLIPPFVISKHISLAVMGNYDYVSNVDECCRLSLDGIDCEVMSARMLTWLNINAENPTDREHVTTLARLNPPKWAKRGFTASYFDQSGVKLSVDTPEDLEAVRKEYDRVGKKLQTAERLYGRESIHRF
jgi:spore coat polysaccharide biosynthesis protein SpsF (cytidylyltransferase family)